MRMWLEQLSCLWCTTTPTASRNTVPLTLLIAHARIEKLMAVSSAVQWPGYDVSLHRV